MSKDSIIARTAKHHQNLMQGTGSPEDRHQIYILSREWIRQERQQFEQLCGVSTENWTPSRGGYYVGEWQDSCWGGWCARALVEFKSACAAFITASTDSEVGAAHQGNKAAGQSESLNAIEVIESIEKISARYMDKYKNGCSYYEGGVDALDDAERAIRALAQSQAAKGEDLPNFEISKFPVVVGDQSTTRRLGGQCHHCGWMDWICQDDAAYCQACGKPHGSVPTEGLPSLPQLLRKNADLNEGKGEDLHTSNLERDAADEIERLRREISRLRANATPQNRESVRNAALEEAAMDTDAFAKELEYHGGGYHPGVSMLLGAVDRIRSLKSRASIGGDLQIWPEKPTDTMLEALRTGSRKDWPSDELCRVRYAALRAAVMAAQQTEQKQGVIDE